MSIVVVVDDNDMQDCSNTNTLCDTERDVTYHFIWLLIYH